MWFAWSARVARSSGTAPDRMCAAATLACGSSTATALGTSVSRSSRNNLLIRWGHVRQGSASRRPQPAMLPMVHAVRLVWWANPVLWCMQCKQLTWWQWQSHAPIGCCTSPSVRCYDEPSALHSAMVVLHSGGEGHTASTLLYAVALVAASLEPAW